MLYTPHTDVYISDGECNMGRYTKHYIAYGGEVGFIPRRPVPGRPSVDEPALDEPALDEPALFHIETGECASLCGDGFLLVTSRCK